MHINTDAIFIADAHMQKNRSSLLYELNKLEQDTPSQIFLMGDI